MTYKLFFGGKTQDLKRFDALKPIYSKGDICFDQLSMLTRCHGASRESINSRLEELEALSVECIFL